MFYYYVAMTRMVNSVVGWLCHCNCFLSALSMNMLSFFLSFLFFFLFFISSFFFLTEAEQWFPSDSCLQGLSTRSLHLCQTAPWKLQKCASLLQESSFPSQSSWNWQWYHSSAGKGNGEKELDRRRKMESNRLQPALFSGKF